jgi:tripeptide aminopeptidase
VAKGAEPVRRGDRIVPAGRTALGGDDRAGVAAVLSALDELQRQNLAHPPLAVVFTVCEESGVRGAAALRPGDLGGAALGFNFDGRDPATISIGAIGKAFIDIEVRGIAAHAGVRPERGVSAVAIFAGATQRLEADGWLGAIHREDGRGTSNIGAVHGGDATNVVTDRLVARAEARSHDPAFLQGIVEAYRTAFGNAAAERSNADGQSGQAGVDFEVAYDAYRLDEDAPVVQVAVAAAERVGLTPSLYVANGGTDANWLVRHGIPTVTLGCGTHRSHTIEESVSIEEFTAACRLALELVTS